MSDMVYYMGGRAFPDGRSYSPEKLAQLKRELPDNYKIMLIYMRQTSQQTAIQQQQNRQSFLDLLADGINALYRFVPGHANIH